MTAALPALPGYRSTTRTSTCRAPRHCKEHRPFTAIPGFESPWGRPLHDGWIWHPQRPDLGRASQPEAVLIWRERDRPGQKRPQPLPREQGVASQDLTPVSRPFFEPLLKALVAERIERRRAVHLRYVPPQRVPPGLGSGQGRDQRFEFPAAIAYRGDVSCSLSLGSLQFLLEGLRKDYVRIAISILKERQDEDLRKWAVKVLDENSRYHFRRICG